MKHNLKAIGANQKEELEMEYPEYVEYTTSNPIFYCYGLKEIAAEKIRALLTRRGFKARDIIDLYYLRKEGVTIGAVKNMAIEKTEFMLKYLKYKENLENKKFEEKFRLDEEEWIVIEEPGKDFEKFVVKTAKELNELAEEFRNKLKEKS